MDINLTTSELRVLDILWSKGVPMSVQEISQEMPSLTLTTIHRIANSLEKKELIKVGDLKKNANAYARAFEPTILPKDYIAAQAKSNILKYEIAVSDFINTLVGDEISDDTIKELENMLDNKKE